MLPFTLPQLSIKPRRLLRRLTRGLRGQLLLATTVPVVALLLALSVVGVFGYTRMTQALIEERDAELVQLAARQVADYWSETVLLLTQMASTIQLREGGGEQVQQLLAANMALRNRFDEISIVDAQGVIYATVGGEMGRSVAELPFFDRTRQWRRPVRSSLYTNEDGERVIAISVPIFDTFGRFAGCSLGIWRIQGDYLGLPVDKIRVGEAGFGYLVNEFGTILYHPDLSLVDADASGHPAVTLLLRGGTGALTTRALGVTYVVGYAPIPLDGMSSSLFADDSWRGWGLLTSERWDDIMAPLQPYIRLMAVLLGLIVTLPIAILSTSTRRIVAPMQQLVAEAERVASGDWDSKVQLNAGPSELRDLEVAFNVMVAQIGQYRRDIQRYIVSILASQEQERKRVARELHDDTAQALIVLGRRIEMAQDLLPPADGNATTMELVHEMESVRDLVDDTLQSVRRFTRDLRPPLLEELGLARTLDILASRTEREEPFAVKVRIVGEVQPLSPELELSLYRLAQEGLSNARRHAQATAVEIVLTYGAEEVSLDVHDDGIGFSAPNNPTELMNSGRLGLMGIHERARLFNGRASFVSAPGQGTTIHVEIPLSELARAKPTP